MEILTRIKDILISPWNDPSMLWEVLPLIATILILEIYFGKYKNEELGWNSALSNSLILIYIGTNLLHYLYLENLFDIAESKTITAILVVVIGIFIAVMDFYHVLPRKLSFGISSTLPINYLAFLAIIFVHGHLIIDKITLYSSFIIFFVLLIIIKIIQSFEEVSPS